MATKHRKDKAATQAEIIEAIKKASEVAKKASKAATKAAELTDKATVVAASKGPKAILAEVVAAAVTKELTKAALAAGTAAVDLAAAAANVITPLLTELNYKSTEEIAAFKAAAKASNAAEAAADAALTAAFKATIAAAPATLKASSKAVEAAAAEPEKASEAAAKAAAEVAREASKAAKEAAKVITAFLTTEVTEEAVDPILNANGKASKAAKVAAKAAEEALKAIKPAARAELNKSKKKIKENKPKPSGVKFINPSDDSDWQMIKYNPKLSEKVKENFKKDRYVPDELMQIQEAGPQGTGNVIGNFWHKFLGDRIKGKEIEEEACKKVADLIFEKLMESEFGCIDLFDSNFLLYGFMHDEEQVYLWRGDADAIGWYYNEKRKQYEYVIIDWKVLRDLRNFWKSNEAFGKYLHQCLVYAKLLQLHLDLDYLPSIMMLAISSNTWQRHHPGLFWDYPDECKSEIDKRFSWFIDQPDKPPREVIWTEDLFNVLDTESDFSEKKLLKEEKLLKDLFVDGAKVKDLLKAFDFSGLKVIIDENFKED